MTTAWRFFSFLKSDLLQSIRGRGVWLAMALLLISVWQCFPSQNLNFLSLAVLPQKVEGTAVKVFQMARGYYSSAWIALSLGYVFSIFVTTVGFFIVRGSVAKDIESGVWSILAATPLSRFEYLLAKWFSQVLVLTSLYCACVVVAVIEQWIRAEDLNIHWSYFAISYFWIVLPAIAITVAMAIVFDIRMELRHTVGSIAYAVVWVLVAVQLSKWFVYADTTALLGWLLDLTGFNAVQHMVQSGYAAGAGQRLNTANILIGGYATDLPKLFHFSNFDIPKKTIESRWLWFTLAIGIIFLTSFRMDRQASRLPARAILFDKRSGTSLRWVSSLLAPLQRSRSGILVASEILSIARSRQLWWWLGLTGLWAGQMFADFDAAPTQVSIFSICTFGAWILCLDVFTRTGLRELETGTHGLIFCTESAHRTVLWMRFAALATMSLLVVLPALLRSTAAEPLAALRVLALGVAIAAFGMLCGFVTRGSRSAEMVFLLLAYATYEGLPYGNVLTMENSSLMAYVVFSLCTMVALPMAWDYFREKIEMK